jgi:hypothetical protein
VRRRLAAVSAGYRHGHSTRRIDVRAVVSFSRRRALGPFCSPVEMGIVCVSSLMDVQVADGVSRWCRRLLLSAHVLGTRALSGADRRFCRRGDSSADAAPLIAAVRFVSSLVAGLNAD